MPRNLDLALSLAIEYRPLIRSIGREVAVRHPGWREDIDHDLFLLAIDFLSLYDPERSNGWVSLYIRRYFRFRMLAYERDRFYRMPMVSLDEIEESLCDPLAVSREPDPAELIRSRDSFDSMLARLPSIGIRVMRMRYEEDLEVQEVARRLRIGLSKAEQIARNSLRILRGDVTRRHHPCHRSVLVDGRRGSIRSWASDPRCVVGYGTLKRRISERGDEPLAAMTLPVRVRPGSVQVAAFGEAKTILAWSNDPRCVVSYSTLQNRIRVEGMSGEQALTLPGRSPHRWTSADAPRHGRLKG